MKDEATHPTVNGPDWDRILQLCDLVVENDVNPKYAMKAIEANLLLRNEYTNLQTLCILDSMVKNCGETFHAELANSIYAILYKLSNTTTPESVFQRIFTLIKTWSTTFVDNPKYVVFRDLACLLESDDFDVPGSNFDNSAAETFALTSACTLCENYVCETCSQRHTSTDNYVTLDPPSEEIVLPPELERHFDSTDELSEALEVQLAMAISASEIDSRRGIAQMPRNTTARPLPDSYNEPLSLDQASGKTFPADPRSGPRQNPPPKSATKVCVICLENEAQNAFIPCGHKVICKNCTSSVKSRNPKKCVLCRKPWKKILTIYE
ncbi:hepatocyte growth factor-regulated tyrosine kinase substrate-like isoform X2 [Zophobas morio]|uniref:hepatocyte growth factor-regulated tyrosine kinase substrate-like isoform X2 n=1 Tax=Zophobas morio TaxID=2755281 RepID=UPI0030836F64